MKKILLLVLVLLISMNFLYSVNSTLIPSTAILRVELKVEKLFTSSYYKQFKDTPKGRQAMAKFDKIKEMIGIDPEKAVSNIELYAAKPISKHEKLIMFHINTKIPNEKVKSLITADALKKGTKLENLEIEGFKAVKLSPKNKDVGIIIFLAEGDLAICSEKWASEAVKNYKGKKVVNKVLGNVDKKFADMIINASAIVPQEAKAKMAMNPPAAPFSKVNIVNLGVNSVNKGLRLLISLNCSKVEDATTISNGLNGFMMMGRMFLAKKNLAEVLDYIKVSLEGTNVVVDFNVTEEQITKLLTKLKSLKPGMVPMPMKKSIKKTK